MNIMRQNSMLAIMTLGMTVVILSVDLSVGALVALGGVVAAMLAGQGPRGIVGGIASATLLGVVNGLLVSRAGSSRSLLRYSPRALRAGWHHRGEVDCGIIGSLGTCLAGQGFIGPIPVPVHGCAPVFRSLVHAAQEPIRVAHVRGRRQRGGLPSWA